MGTLSQRYGGPSLGIHKESHPFGRKYVCTLGKDETLIERFTSKTQGCKTILKGPTLKRT